MASAQLVVRVKRRREDEPTADLVVEATAKRHHMDASSIAMRLVDTVAPGQWSFDEGLPTSWLKAAAHSGTWGEVLRRLPNVDSSSYGAERPRPALQEVERRRLPGTCAVGGVSVQLIDVEPVSHQSQLQWTSPMSASMLSAALGAPPPSSIFTCDGVPLVSSKVVEPQSALGAHERRSDQEGDFVWDVYVPSDTMRGGLDDIYDDWPCSSAFVRLAAPAFDGDEWEDFDDIDDSQSDRGSRDFASDSSDGDSDL